MISSSAANGSSISRISGIGDQRARQRYPHLHAAGQFAGIGVGKFGEADLRQRLFDTRGRPPPPAHARVSAAAAHFLARWPTASASVPETRSRSNALTRVAAVRLETRTLPELGALRPAISRSAVDLPQPDGPSSETNSPLADVEIERPQRHHAVVIDLGDAAKADREARRAGAGVGQGSGSTIAGVLVLRPQVRARHPC